MKACPFCGSMNVELVLNHNAASVVCNQCQAHGPSVRVLNQRHEIKRVESHGDKRMGDLSEARMKWDDRDE